MPKYTITIEFETTEKLRFPVDAQVLAACEAQLEGLCDGDYGKKIDYTIGDCKIKQEE